MEIEFKAWHKLEKRMIDPVIEIDLTKGNQRIGWYETMEDAMSGCITDESMSNVELLQWSGLTDKDGIKICKGDIREFDDMGEEGYEYIEGFDFKNRAVVVFENGRFTLDKFMSSNSYVLEEIANHEEFYQTLEGSTYIGNIYENAELLKQLEV